MEKKVQNFHTRWVCALGYQWPPLVFTHGVPVEIGLFVEEEKEVC